eukprot:3419824-Rhodomonas_salina.1
MPLRVPYAMRGTALGYGATRLLCAVRTEQGYGATSCGGGGSAPTSSLAASPSLLVPHPRP